MLKGYLAKGALGTATLHLVSTALFFLISIVLTKVSGVEALGIYSNAVAWTSILVILATLGKHSFLVRSISQFVSKNATSLLSGIISFSLKITFIASIVVTAVFAIIVIFFFEEGSAVNPLLLSLILIPIQTIAFIIQSILSGFKRVVIGQLSLLVIVPLFTLILIAISPYFFSSVSPEIAIMILIAANIIGLGVNLILLQKIIPERIKNAKKKVRAKEWLLSAKNFLGIALLYMLSENIGVIILSSMGNFKEAGIFAVTHKLGSMVVFIQRSINSPLAPHIAEYDLENDKHKLQKIVSRASLISFTFAFSLSAIFFFFGEDMLQIFWGDEFIIGIASLLIVALGALVNVSCGAVGLLLTMRGFETIVFKTQILSNGVQIILGLMLAPTYGATGVAIGWAASNIIWNFILLYFVWTKLKIFPAFISILITGRNNSI